MTEYIFVLTYDKCHVIFCNLSLDLFWVWVYNEYIIKNKTKEVNMKNQNNKTPRIKSNFIAYYDRNALSCYRDKSVTDKNIFVVKSNDFIIAVCGDIRSAYHVWKQHRDISLSMGLTWNSLSSIIKMDVTTF